MRESTWATDERNEIGLEPDDYGDWYFTALMQCVVPECGQITSIAGTARYRDESRNWDERELTAVLSPRMIFPAPPLATIAEGTPEAVEAELRTSFALFWTDLGSCANRLRISVERLLDSLGVAPGATLAARITQYQSTDPTHAATFDALRHVGNLGSHEGHVEREALLDAFEILQDALAELFGRRTQRIAAMRQRLIDTKGVY